MHWQVATATAAIAISLWTLEGEQRKKRLQIDILSEKLRVFEEKRIWVCFWDSQKTQNKLSSFFFSFFCFVFFIKEKEREREFPKAELSWVKQILRSVCHVFTSSSHKGKHFLISSSSHLCTHLFIQKLYIYISIYADSKLVIILVIMGFFLALSLQKT